MREFFEFLKEGLGLVLDAGAAGIGAYATFVKKATKYFGLFLAGALAILLAGGVSGLNFLIGLSFVLAGVVLGLWFMAVFPLAVAVQVGAEKIGAVKRTLQWIGIFVLWVFFLALYFFLVPIPKAAVGLIILLALAMAISAVIFGTGITTKFIALRLGIIFTLLTAIFVFSFLFPKSSAGFKDLLAWADERLSGSMGKVINPLPPGPAFPSQIRYGKNLMFFHPLTGEPQIYYYKRDDGEYDLFSAPGFHPKYNEKLKPITPAVVKAIEKKLEEDKEKPPEEGPPVEKPPEVPPKTPVEVQPEEPKPDPADPPEPPVDTESPTDTPIDIPKVDSPEIFYHSSGHFKKVGKEWHEFDSFGNHVFTFIELGLDYDRILLEDKSREMFLSLPVKGGLSYWSFERTGGWKELYILEIEKDDKKDLTYEWVTIPAGAQVKVSLHQLISTAQNHIGDNFLAGLEKIDPKPEPAVDESTIVRDQGRLKSIVAFGRIVELQRPGRVKGLALLSLQLIGVTIEYESGSKSFIQLETEPTVIGGEATKGEDAVKIIVGGGIGSVIGVIFGGKKGAAEGAATGAGAATTGVMLTRGQDIVLPAETILNFRVLNEVRFFEIEVRK